MISYAEAYSYSMITTIIFDFGGVFTTDDDIGNIGKYLAKKYDVPLETVKSTTWDGWSKARLDPKYDARFWRKLADVLGISERQLLKEYMDYPNFLPEVAHFARALRKKYRIVMLSNQIESWHKALMKRYRLTRSFDEIYTSYSEGIAKPDPKIYKQVLKKLGVFGGECVFIDDREYNLAPAEALGMDTVHFKTLARLEKDLKKSGVAL